MILPATIDLLRLMWSIAIPVIFLIVSMLIHKSIMWAVLVVIILIVSFTALIGKWELIYFVPLAGILVISVMGFVNEKNTY